MYPKFDFPIYLSISLNRQLAVWNALNNEQIKNFHKKGEQKMT